MSWSACSPTRTRMRATRSRRRPSPRGGGTPPRLYSRHGFKPIARVQWDDAYTDPHWNHTRLGLPDTVAIDAPAHASPRVRDA